MLKSIILSATTAALLGCSHPQISKDRSMETRIDSVPIEYARHLIVVPVKINGSIDSRFILDTGIGLNLITDSLCKKIRCKISGSYTGKRMSGQELKIPLSKLTSLSVGSHELKDVTIGVFPELEKGIDGFVSLEFLADVPFTIDYKNKTLTFETTASLTTRKSKGQSIPITIERDHSTVGIFISMEVPHGPPAKVEVDTGSDSFILHERYMSRLGIKPDGSAVKRVDAKDETNHPYTRYFTNISGSIWPSGAPSMAHENPKVMFQKIIYDGLVGQSFLENFDVTYDLPHSQIILARPQ